MWGLCFECFEGVNLARVIFAVQNRLTPCNASSSVTRVKTIFAFRSRRPRIPPAPAGCLIMAALCLSGCSDIVAPTRSGWEGELEPVPPAEVRGSVAVISQSGRSETSILITNAVPGETYSWRIRSGSCDTSGDVVGGAAVYPPLSPDDTGEAEGQTTLSRELEPGNTYAALVFLSPAVGDAELVACGELARLTQIS